jgi:hypothetical protein
MVTQNLNKKRLDTYKDFTICLVYTIVKLYIDKESLNNDNDIRNHYNYCFNKVCDEFLKEELNFKDNYELREYYYGYFYFQFYKSISQDLKYHKNFWNEIFQIKKNYTNKNYLTILVETYQIFDITINNKTLEKSNEKILDNTLN